MQFTSGGHVLGFASGRAYLAALSHALAVEFVGSRHVTPQGAAAGPSDEGQASPLGHVLYPDLWPGISLRYEPSDGVVKSTYVLAPGADADQIACVTTLR